MNSETTRPRNGQRAARRALWLLVPLAVALALLALLRQPTRAATIAVADGAVAVADNNICSLIEAISNANDTGSGQPFDDCAAGNPSGADVVELAAAGAYTLTDEFTSESFFYTNGQEVFALGLPSISTQITVNGNESAIVVDDGLEIVPFGVLTTGQLALNDLELIGNGEEGPGAIVTNGPLSLDGVVIADFYGIFLGGGSVFCQGGPLDVANSQFAFNAGYVGGAILGYECDISFTDSIAYFNQSAIGGALAVVSGTLNVVRSTLILNLAEEGCGAHVLSAFNSETAIVNSTVSSGFGVSLCVVTLEGPPGVDLITPTMTIDNSTIVSTDELGDFPSAGIYAGLDFYAGRAVADKRAAWDAFAAAAERAGLRPPAHWIPPTMPAGSFAGALGASLPATVSSPITTTPMVTVTNSIIAGQGDNYQFGIVAEQEGYVVSGGGNVLGSEERVFADEFYNFTPEPTDFVASNGEPDATPFGDIVLPFSELVSPDGVLQVIYFGLPGQSPALDRVPSADCAGGPTGGVDQLGNPRNADFPDVNNGPTRLCDAGAIEEGEPPQVFVSTSTSGTTGDGVEYFPEDILGWDGSGWSLFFDGSDYGLTHNLRFKHNINALYIPNPATPDGTVMSFWQNRRVVPGVDGKVDGMDLVTFNGSAFDLYFDGQDVGLTALTNEKIDGLHILGGDEAPQALKDAAGGSCEAYLLISTHGAGFVPNYDATTIRFSGEDVLGFCLTQSGATTQGQWIKVLDGSDAGLARNSLDSLSADETGDTLYITTKRTFDWNSLTVMPSRVYQFDLGSGQLSGPEFEAPANGLPSYVDALQWGRQPPDSCAAASDC